MYNNPYLNNNNILHEYNPYNIPMNNTPLFFFPTYDPIIFHMYIDEYIDEYMNNNFKKYYKIYQNKNVSYFEIFYPFI